MKTLIILIAVTLVSCGESKSERDLRQAEELIEKTKKDYTSDSLSIENWRKIEEAKAK